MDKKPKVYTAEQLEERIEQLARLGTCSSREQPAAWYSETGAMLKQLLGSASRLKPHGEHDPRYYLEQPVAVSAALPPGRTPLLPDAFVVVLQAQQPLKVMCAFPGCPEMAVEGGFCPTHGRPP